MAVDQQEPAASGYVGSPQRKHDGDAYVTGRVTYTDDVVLPGTLHVAILGKRPATVHVIVSTMRKRASPAIILS